MADTTTEAFARKIDRSLRTVTRWRSDHNQPSASDLVLIADALGVDPRDLIPPTERRAA